MADRSGRVVGCLVGGAIVAIGGVIEIMFGVNAEGNPSGASRSH